MGSFTYRVPANTYWGKTKAEANDLARQAGTLAAQTYKFCCDVTPIMACVGAENLTQFEILLGKPPFTIVPISGMMPTGMYATVSDDNKYVEIRGTPIAATNTLAVVGLRDANNQQIELTLEIYVAGIIDDTLANGTVGTAYSHQLTTVGGSGSFYFSSSGVMPPGLFVTAQGVIGGVPTTAGTYTFNISITDQASDNPIRGTFMSVLLPAYLNATAQNALHIFGFKNWNVFEGLIPDYGRSIQGGEVWNGVWVDYDNINVQFPPNTHHVDARKGRVLLQHVSGPPEYWQVYVTADLGPGLPTELLLWHGVLLGSRADGIYVRKEGFMTDPANIVVYIVS